MADKPTVNMDQLRIGLYVYLDLKWFEHPFAFSHFKIKTEDQIETIRSLRLKTVRYDPALSDGYPPAHNSPEAASGQAAAEAPRDISPALAAKRNLIERIKQQREAAARVEHAFVDTANTIRDIEKNVYSKPEETVQKATQLVTQIADSILSAPELAIHIMGDKTEGEEIYFHSLNVTMLSMMMARDLKLPKEVIGALGIGALLHDIGRQKIPSKILMKMEPLSSVELRFYELHCQYGVEIGQQLGLSPVALTIIREHHELFDGTGYPARLQGESIGQLARIVAIANYYDELCNPMNIARAVTPHEALSMMFAQLRSKFDPKILQIFVRCLGVYPPGTIVQLSNGAIGMIATVNTAKPMRPMVVIYDTGIPKEEAIMLDLETATDVNIEKAIRPAQVPREIYNYLNPCKRVSYYFDARGAGHESLS